MPETLTEILERMEQAIEQANQEPGQGLVAKVKVSDLRLLITALERALDM